MDPKYQKKVKLNDGHFIPVLGYLDDLLLVPLGIMLAVRVIPPTLVGEFRALAAAREDDPTSRVGMVVIIVLWLLALALIAYFVFPH